MDLIHSWIKEKSVQYLALKLEQSDQTLKRTVTPNRNTDGMFNALNRALCDSEGASKHFGIMCIKSENI